MNIKVIERLDKILINGLIAGPGDKITSFCTEEAFCAALGIRINDRPECVNDVVSALGRKLNDARWPNNMARARGMRNFAIAQFGSKSVVKSYEFAPQFVLRVIREVLPHWLKRGKINEILIAACENAKTINEGQAAVEAIYYLIKNSFCVTSEVNTTLNISKNIIKATICIIKCDVYVANRDFNCANEAADLAVRYAIEEISEFNTIPSIVDNEKTVLAVTLPLLAHIATEILCNLNSPGAEFLSHPIC